MKKRFYIIFSLLLVFGCEQSHELTEDPGMPLSKAMSDIAETDFEKAVDRRIFIFPEDHGAHPDFRTEWWYFTGNLTAEANKKFGYQFTIFRTGLSRIKPVRNSEWNSNQIYMAHFAVTDISEGKFYFAERFSREGNNLAGVQMNPLHIWQEDWQILQVGNRIFYDLPVLSIEAKTDEAGIRLTVQSQKPIVLQGDAGLSQKGAQSGNASYYYSYTRLQTKGIVTLKGKEYNVSGYSWLDREWSTSALSKDQKGWDWFALQLEDTTEIMYYQMRKTDGRADIYSKGSFVQQDGTFSLITKDDVILHVLDYWESPSGVKYPSGWQLEIPSKNLDLTIRPAIQNQLLDVTIKYWEGAVDIRGTKDSFEIRGRGYVELTGD